MGTRFLPRDYAKTLHLRKPDDVSSIRKYYQSFSSPSNVLPKLSPLDLSKEWESSHVDEELNKAVMSIAPSVVAVSTFAFASLRRKIDCSGIVIDFNDATGEGTVLTSAKVLKFPGDADKKHNHVVVRLANGDIVAAEEDYVDFCLNIVTLKIKSEKPLPVLDLDAHSIVEGSKVVALGRDFFGTFQESCGVIHLQYPYFGCQELVSTTCVISEVSEGGPLITKSGCVCGINFFDNYRRAHPLTSSTIKESLRCWRNFGSVSKPWFGLTLVDSSRLSHDARQKLNLSLDSESLVLVKEVHKESPASEAGVRSGDRVLACGKQYIRSTAEYSSTMVDLMWLLSFGGAPQESMQVIVQRHSDGGQVVVAPLVLPVTDRRFFSCWPRIDRNLWYEQQKFGSQNIRLPGFVAPIPLHLETYSHPTSENG